MTELQVLIDLLSDFTAAADKLYRIDDHKHNCSAICNCCRADELMGWATAIELRIKKLKELTK